MSDTPKGVDWWQASDGRWYPPSGQAAGSGAASVGQGLAHPPAGELGWWQAANGLWYPPHTRPVPPPLHLGGYQQPPGYTAPRTNGLAIAALVLSLVACGVGSILGLIFGYVSRGQIDRSQGRETGRGLATAGIILGYVGLVVIFGVIAVTLLGTSASTKFSSVANSIGN